MNVVEMILTSCLVLLLATDATSADIGERLRPVEYVKIHLSKTGGGTIEASLFVPGDFSETAAAKTFKASDYDILAKYGVTDLKYEPERINKQFMRIVSRGKFADVLRLVRILDSGNPFIRRRNNTFDVAWNGNLLKLHMKILDVDRPANLAHVNNEPTIEITTDGRFTENSTGGHISDDRSTFTMSSPGTELLLEIEGLGVK